MDFGYVLRRAWEIIWKFKVLWIFGILASCGQASTSGGSNWSYQFSGDQGDFPLQFERFFTRLDPGAIALLIGLGILIMLIIIVLVVLLGTVGRIGLIRGTLKAEHGADRLTFGELWREGLTYFWRVFGLNLLIGVIIFLVFLAIFIPGAILTAVTVGLFALCLIPLACLLVPVYWAVTVVIEQANVALVVEDLGIIQAIQRGWQVVRDNIGSMLVMSLILVVGVGLIGGAVIGLPLILVVTPTIIGYSSGTVDAIRNGWILSGLFLLIYLPILLVLSGILRSYISSAWTLTFMRLTAKPAQALVEVPDRLEDITPPPAENI
jgi:hypothetical protein